jgi:hypothetical protein
VGEFKKKEKGKRKKGGRQKEREKRHKGEGKRLDPESNGCPSG